MNGGHSHEYLESMSVKSNGRAGRAAPTETRRDASTPPAALFQARVSADSERAELQRRIATRARPTLGSSARTNRRQSRSSPDGSAAAADGCPGSSQRDFSTTARQAIAASVGTVSEGEPDDDHDTATTTTARPRPAAPSPCYPRMACTCPQRQLRALLTSLATVSSSVALGSASPEALELILIGGVRLVCEGSTSLEGEP
jgi:hypothetical protein